MPPGETRGPGEPRRRWGPGRDSARGSQGRPRSRPGGGSGGAGSARIVRAPRGPAASPAPAFPPTPPGARGGATKGAGEAGPRGLQPPRRTPGGGGVQISASDSRGARRPDRPAPARAHPRPAGAPGAHPPRAPPPEPPEPPSRGPARRGNGKTGGAVTCREWDLGSGGLKKESGSFRSLMGTVCGTLAVLGFMTALKSASRSVSESPRTCTIWWPAGGACGAAGGPGGAGCPGADGGPWPWGACAGGGPWPWGAGCGGGGPGSMAPASPGGRGLRPDGPARRAAAGEAAGAALASRSGPGAAPRPRSPRPAPGSAGLRRVGRGAGDRGPRRPRSLPRPELRPHGPRRSPPPRPVSSPCSFLPLFLSPGGGRSRLRRKLASDAKTKVGRRARPSGRGPASSRRFLPLRARPRQMLRETFPGEGAAFLRTPAAAAPPARVPARPASAGPRGAAAAAGSVLGAPRPGSRRPDDARGAGPGRSPGSAGSAAALVAGGPPARQAWPPPPRPRERLRGAPRPSLPDS